MMYVVGAVLFYLVFCLLSGHMTSSYRFMLIFALGSFSLW